ncbi:hypothetical protein NQ317_018837, partial [Molorchus minor]
SCTRSSSSSSSLADLEGITKNDGGSHRCSFTDLHLEAEPTTEMVINLPATDRPHQWREASPSRDAHAIRPTSWLSEVASLAQLVADGVTSDGSSSTDGGDMQVNVPCSDVATSVVPSNSPQNLQAADDGLRGDGVSVHNQGGPGQQYQATLLNLSSANVVGLPSHTRYASVPVGTSPEPSHQFLKYQNNGQSPGNHQRHSAQVDQPATHQISHLRSSSVPKSMPVVPRHDSGTTTTTTTTVPRLNPQKPMSQIPNNVSNVNVNFYRAVPVNVVSSVPTIQCINSLSNAQGNSVSNVQVLPLGANFQTHNIHLPNTLGGIGFSNVITSGFTTGTTQVILHNTQSSTNSIQVPSNFQNVSRSTILNPQVVPVQPAKSAVNAGSNTITNFLPPPPIICASNHDFIQNARPISSPAVPMVTIQQNCAENRTRSHSNAGISANTAPQQNAPGSSSTTASKPNNEIRTPRTFTSTEAQTDETSVAQPSCSEPPPNREQRRRDRRERRHQRRVNGTAHRYAADGGTHVGGMQNDRLPDILNSHLPPPYSTLPNHTVMTSMPPPPPMVPMVPHPAGAVLQSVVPNNVVPPSGFVFQAPPPSQVIPGQMPMMQAPAPVAVPVAPPSGFRFPFPANGFRR